VAPLGLARQPRALAIVVAAVAHVAAIVLVGGDWMPKARLMVPVVPSLVLAAALVAGNAHPLAIALRSLLAVALGMWLILVKDGTAGRRVGADREALIAHARPLLDSAHVSRVAALDVGWVSAATEADIIDLGGLTDPDLLLVYAPNGPAAGGLGDWPETATPRVVEARLIRDEAIQRHFDAVAWLALGTGRSGYVALRSR